MMDLPQQPVYVIIPSLGPSIESDRLLLRPATDSDASALFDIRSRPEVAEMNYPKQPFKSIEETREWMLSKVFSTGPSDAIGRSFNYAIVDKSSAEPQRAIGYISINQVDPFPEIGYSVHPDAWGKGVATEALQLMLKMWWSLPRRNVDGENSHSAAVEKAFALCEKKNAGSRRVLEKCGFNVVGDYRFGDDELFLFAVERP